MREFAAVVAALDMHQSPSTVRLAQRAPLPSGTSFLLEIAAGEADAIELACRKTGRSEERLREAAGFFVEQVLLRPECDSYRVLGGALQSAPQELRRNMAYLLKWLHPDVASNNGIAGELLDRSVFANRVTQAWEDLKTDQRRTSYDEKLAAQRDSRSAGNAGNRRPGRGMPRQRWHQIPQHRIKREDFVTRLVRLLLGGRR